MAAKKTAKKSSKTAAKTSKKKAAKKKAGKKAGKKTAKKTTTKSAKKATDKPGARKAAKHPEKDPKGGLTAAGRRAFAKKDGSHLKPGVMKSDADMSPADMRRKGSWAVRFYGRASLPPLTDKNGEPTRLALSAHAWGEPVPKTEAAARRIAAKGKSLLKKYHELKEASST